MYRSRIGVNRVDLEQLERTGGAELKTCYLKQYSAPKSRTLEQISEQIPGESSTRLLPPKRIYFSIGR